MNAQLQSSELNINKRSNSTLEKPRTSFFIPTISIEDEGRELNQHAQEESPDSYVQQQAQERFQARMERLHKTLLHKNEAAELSEDLSRSELRNSQLEKQLKEHSETLKVIRFVSYGNQKEMEKERKKLVSTLENQVFESSRRKLEIDSARSALFELNRDLETLVEFVAKLSESNKNSPLERLMRVKIKSLTEELQTLKEKNHKLKEITAGLLGKQLNFRDARIGLLEADLQEKEKLLETFEGRDNSVGLKNSNEAENDGVSGSIHQEKQVSKSLRRNTNSELETTKTSNAHEEVIMRRNKK